MADFANLRALSAFVILVLALLLHNSAPSTTPSLASTARSDGTARSPLLGVRILVISHDASASGAPRVCAELAQSLAGLGASVSLAVQGRARVRRADREALMSLLAPLTADTAAFPVVGLTSRAVHDADVVVVSTAVAANSAWVTAGSTTSADAPPFFSHSGIVSAVFDLAALVTGASRSTAAFMRPQARLVWLVHESGAVMRALGHSASEAALSAMSGPRSRVDRVVFVSNAAMSWWHEQLRLRDATVSAQQQLVLHWGVPSWKLDHLLAPARIADARARLRRQLGFGEVDFVFLVVGSFHPMKGHAGIVRAFLDAQASCQHHSAITRLRLVAVGGGLGAADYFPCIFSEAAEIFALDDVRLLPSTSDVGAYFAVADAFVGNTQCEGETWGLATLEALAAGKPVLAAAVGGTLEQMQHNITALLHPPTCVTFDEIGESGAGKKVAYSFGSVAAPGELAAHMCAVATDAALAKRLGAAGSEHVRNALGQAQIDAALVEAFS